MYVQKKDSFQEQIWHHKIYLIFCASWFFKIFLIHNHSVFFIFEILYRSKKMIYHLILHAPQSLLAKNHWQIWSKNYVFLIYLIHPLLYHWNHLILNNFLFMIFYKILMCLFFKLETLDFLRKNLFLISCSFHVKISSELIHQNFNQKLLIRFYLVNYIFGYHYCLWFRLLNFLTN